MEMDRNRPIGLSLFTLFVALSLPALALSAQKEITREGTLVVVSKYFAEAVKKDNSVVLSTVAVKSRVDRNGRLQGFQLFQIDKGSPVEKMGFKTKDILTGVNGIPARDIEANRKSLENEQRFEVTILRNGGEKKVRIVIR
jgi:S1-C subfamily serine protease